jgi:glycosyltransferase involved in cell wall biosynthesis
MRVLFVTRKFPPSIGGMEVYSAQLFEALGKEVLDLDLLKPAFAIHGRPSVSRLLVFYISASIQLLLRARSYDVILLGDYAIAGLALVAKLASLGQTRVVVSLHGNDVYFMRRRSLKARTYSLASSLIVASRTLDAAIANSAATAEEARSRGISPVHVVPLATVIPHVPAETRRKPAQLLFAGRLVRCKGLSWFMREVWPRLPAETSLVVAGPAWDREELVSITNIPRVQYLGALPSNEIPRLRAESMACIMPNLPPEGEEQGEGFGIAALEGPAVGTPTLASRSGGLVDAVSDGVTGFLLPPMDPAAWANRIRRIAAWLPDERANFERKSKEYVARHYNWALVAQRTVAILRGVVQRTKGSAND